MWWWETLRTKKEKREVVVHDEDSLVFNLKIILDTRKKENNYDLKNTNGYKKKGRKIFEHRKMRIYTLNNKEKANKKITYSTDFFFF